MKKIDCRYDQSSGIFYKYYTGDITLNEILESWESIISNKLIPVNTRKFILDYSKGRLLATPQEAKDIAGFYKKHPEIFSGSRIALIMQKPDQVIFPVLVNQEQSIVYFRPFYTLDAALDWMEGF